MTATVDPPTNVHTTGGTPGVDRRHRAGDFFHERTNFDFLRHGRLYLVVFLTVVLGAPLLLALRPLDLGIDFTGGVAWQVNVAKGARTSAAEVRKIAEDAGLGDFKATISSSAQNNTRTIRLQAKVVADRGDQIRKALAKATGKTNAGVSVNQAGEQVTFSAVKVKAPSSSRIAAALQPLKLGGAAPKIAIDKQTVTVTFAKLPTSVRDNVANKLAAYAKSKSGDVSISTVGPTWGDQVSRKALIALVVFFFVLAVYLSIRFELKMAMAAIVAVIHDILFTVAVYAITQFSVSPATVTAFLTILGFSLYDTVVVFDKVKENEGPLKTGMRSTYRDMANRSLNAVLMRSLSTSFVALMPVLSLLLVGSVIFGAASLQDFALALFAGLFVGTYSSIFVAAPLLVWLKEREPAYRAMIERKAARDAAGARSSAVVERKLASVSMAVTPDSPDGTTTDWDTTGVAGPPAVGRIAPVAPRPRQQRGKKRR